MAREEAVEPAKGHHKDDLDIYWDRAEERKLSQYVKITSFVLFYHLCGVPQTLQPAVSQVLLGR